MRLCTFTLAALVAATIPVGTASAQPAAAIGHPLPEGSLPIGTVTVRVVDGSPSKPVVGTDVTLLVNDNQRLQARTDAAGRATFPGLAPGANVQAVILDASQKEVTSDRFPVPAQGGTRVMLSTTPFQGMGASPLPGGMPAAREMSGQPRPDRSDAPGTFTVRLTYNSLTMANGQLVDPSPPIAFPVYLVGYGADDGVKVLSTKVADDGVALFAELDQTSATAYYAMAALPRATGVDRLVAVGTVLDGKAGARVVLSALGRSDTAPPLDDYGKLIPRDGTTVPAGKVRVTLDGVAQEGSQVTLVDARTGKPLGVMPAHVGAPDPTQVQGGAEFEAKPDLPANTLEVSVKGGKGSATDPLPGIEIQLVDLEDRPIDPAAIVPTGADGLAKLAVPAKTQVKAMITINGKAMLSAPIDLSAGGGGRLLVVANWPSTGKPEVTFDLPTGDNSQILYAQTTMAGQTFRSLPFQHLAETGMHVNVYVYPRTLFRFDTHSFVEDQLLAFQGEIQITNYSWSPYRADNDGIEIKLPRHHKGAIVGPQDQEDVAVVTNVGFRILKPIPPGGRTFRMGYSMPIVDGAVDWAFDLPLGTWRSEMKIRQTPNMRVQLPSGVKGETQTATTGEPWFVITDITIERGQSMVMRISGFPAPPGWKVWAPRIMGVLVLLTLFAGLAFAMTRRKLPAAEREAQRARLLDELVELERKGQGGKRPRVTDPSDPGSGPDRKEQVLAELERLWGPQ